MRNLCIRVGLKLNHIIFMIVKYMIGSGTQIVAPMLTDQP